MQRTPAGLPLGIPGMGEEIEGAMQQAPQPTRQSIVFTPSLRWVDRRSGACQS